MVEKVQALLIRVAKKDVHEPDVGHRLEDKVLISFVYAMAATKVRGKNARVARRIKHSIEREDRGPRWFG